MAKKIVRTTGILLIENSKVLLVRHNEGADHLTGVYGIPSGRLEKNEKEIDGALRELKEETGLETTKKDLVRLPKDYLATIKRKKGTETFDGGNFLCLSYRGELVETEETSPEWIDIDKIEKINAFPNVKPMIEEGLEYLEKNIS